MQCECGGTQFRRTVTVKVDLVAIYDEDGSFCEFSGDLEDQIDEQDIVDDDVNENELFCIDCDKVYDDADDPSKDEDYEEKSYCSNCGCVLAENECEFCNKPACQEAAKKYD